MPDVEPVPLPPELARLIRRALLVLVLAGFGVGCTTLPAPAPDGPPELAEIDEPAEPVALAPTPAPRPAPPRPEAAAAPAAPARISDGRELFERLAASFTPPVCVRGDHNRQWRRRYAGHPSSFERQLREALPLLAYVVEAVEERDLPGEFALIPIVESGYRPEARGPGGPAGLWQMIGSTARNHGVQVGRGYDGRLSPVDATDAALGYLATLHAEFGDWRATAMAYNAGEGRLRRAFARHGASQVSGERRLPAGLSNVTYAYVAKLHALACLIAEPGRHGLTLPTDPLTPLEVRRAPDGATRLDDAARAWGTAAETLARWNPAYRAGIARTGAPRRLLVPMGATVAMDPNTPSSAPVAANAETPTVATREHTVRSGETLWRIARRYGTTVRALAEANGIDASRPLRIGKVLRIPD